MVENEISVALHHQAELTIWRDKLAIVTQSLV